MRAKSAIFATAVVLVVMGASSLWSREAHGQPVTKGLRPGECERAAWVDAHTGELVASLPQGAQYTLHKLDFLPGKIPHPPSRNLYDLDHAYNPKHGLNYLRLHDGNWIDEKSGTCPLTFPELAVYPTHPGIKSSEIRIGWNPAIDPNFAHNPNTGESYVHLPWPHPDTMPPVKKWDPSDSLAFGAQGTVEGGYPPPGYCYHWVDEDDDSVFVDTYHEEDNYDPYNEDPDEISINGHVYINVTEDRDDEDHWIDAETGDEVSTEPPDYDDDPDDDYDHIDVDGHHLIRVYEPCDPFEKPAPPYSPPHWIDLLRGFDERRPIVEVGVNLGLIGRTSLYDDDYKVGNTSFFIGGNTGITWPIGGHFYGGGQIGVYGPFQAATLDSTQTKLDAVFPFEGVIGANLQCPHMHRPYDIWGTVGGAIGIERSSYIGTPSYSDREVLPGYTFSVGASLPIYSKPNRDLSLTTEFRYINLSQEKFTSPGGSYGMKDSGFIGDIGLRWNFSHPPPPPPPPPPPR